MEENKVWDKILGDPRRCKWFLHGFCTKAIYTGEIRHKDSFSLCEIKVCEDYEERNERTENVE